MTVSHHRSRIWVSSDAVHGALEFKTNGENSSTSLSNSTTKKKKKRQKDAYTDWGWIRAALINSTEDSWEVLIEDETSPLHGQQVELLKEHNPSTMDENDTHSRINGTHEKRNQMIVQMQNDFSTQDPPDDLITLTHLHEPALVYSLKRRFENNSIYTYTGTILLALNPFKPIPSLYHTHVMNSYFCAVQSKRDPHVYATADSAYRNMMRDLDFHHVRGAYRKAADQSILVSGESGAGKTVTTKHIMKYLAFLSQQRSSNGTNRGKSKNKSSSSSKNNNSDETNNTITVTIERQVSPRRRLRRTPSNSSILSQDVNVHVERKILESNPILESFGNARTIRNDNSSRFGKFIQLQFNSKGFLVGASMETYLLEKVRLLSQSEGERNYHVFYMLLAALKRHELTEIDEDEDEDDAFDMQSAYFLQNYTVQDFFMTSQSGTYDRRDRVSDVEEFEQLETAMALVGFETEIQRQIFGMVSALLHSSNLTFVSISNDESCIERENPHLYPVMTLLGLQVDTFNDALCSFSIEARGETHIRSLPKQKAEKGLEALIKAIYAALFRFIVDSINEVVSTSENVSAYIGVLDIFGFETFKTNSFEQLCINYCNEALQQQFNMFVFKAEQEEYNKEGIEWSFIEYPDNQDVLDLIDKKVSGIISILDDQCKAPGTTDKTFANDIYRKCKRHSRFGADFRQVGARKFAVIHYAGLVEYDTEGFVEKNRDELPREATFLLESSSNLFVKQLAKVHSDSVQNLSPSTQSPRFLTRRSASMAGSTSISPAKPQFRKSVSAVSSGIRGFNSSSRITVGGQFKNQLQSLRVRIDQTCPHYIRCLKPNDLLVANDFNPTMIVEQLRYAGVLEAIRVSRVGFPQRYSHSQFIQRYCVLSISSVKSAIKKGMDDETICNQLVKTISNTLCDKSNNQLSLEQTVESNDLTDNSKSSLRRSRFQIQMGKTKVFLRQEAFDQIEHMRLTKMEKAVVLIQSTMRRYVVEKSYRIMRLGFIHLQSHGRRKSAIKFVQNLRESNASIKIQKYWRMVREQKYFNAILCIAQWFQKFHRGNVIRAEYKRRIHEIYSVITIQCFIRVCASRDVIRSLRAKARDLDAIKNERDELKLQVELLQTKILTLNNASKINESVPNSVITIDTKSVPKEESDLTETRSIHKMSVLKEELETTRLALENMTTEYEENKEKCQNMQNELEKLRLSNNQRLQDSGRDESHDLTLIKIHESEGDASTEKSILLEEVESSKTELHEIKGKYEDSLTKIHQMEQELKHLRMTSQESLQTAELNSGLNENSRQKKGEERVEKESENTTTKQGAFTCSFSKLFAPIFNNSKVSSSTANMTFN